MIETHIVYDRLNGISMYSKLSRSVKSVLSSVHLPQQSVQPPPYDAPFKFPGGTADIDPEWIDINTLKLWLRTCDREHHPKCFDIISLNSGRPRLLIDVVKGSLVPAEDEDQYAALSYVWGQTETVRTSKDNLTYLLEEGSIFACEGLLPKTIKDTMRLVKLLGIKYLWVDCLCVVQDDAELKHAQIQEMGAIYARAYVTIIAANGWDANHGLRGIRNVTEPRHLSRYTEDNFYESLQPHSSIWYSRGWTFQEMIFARRKIMFHYQVAVWECHCATWHEATKTGIIPSITNDAGDVFHMNRWGWKNTFGSWPDVQQYIEMVREYNNRQLTFSADGLHAIAGLMAVWSRSFHGGFICGLPQMFFDDALLWQPSNLFQRRISKTRSNNEALLPSWSWAGWEGEIDSLKWASQWDYLSLAIRKGAVVWKLSSTVDWSYGENHENRQPVMVSSHQYRDCLTDKSIPLPQGWSRRSTAAEIKCNGGSATQIENTELATNDYFVHIRFAGIKFGYPIPLQEESQLKHAQTIPRFLFGRTRRGIFEEHHGTRDPPIFDDLDYDSSPVLIHLLDNHGKWAGMIQLHDGVLVDSFHRLLDRSSKLELVSISAGTASPKRGELIEYYNVMWIEWKEDIAYRKGLGKVRKEAWERQATEWIDLTLG